MVDCYEVKCSYFISQSRELEYCFECFDCKNCFGCVGLKKKSFCIFNRQYEKGDYWELVDRIKTKMLNDGEYGEYFSLKHSLYPYIDTFASVLYPLNSQELEKKQAISFPEEQIKEYPNQIKAQDLPEDIKDVKDDVIEKSVLCEETGRPFRIIKGDLNFYRKHGIPLPTKHPQVRLLDRLKKRNPLKLWHRQCACLSAEALAKEDAYKNTVAHFHGEKPCPNEFETSYAPERKEIIYCEECYNAEVL